jgi:drug/metabolite transporter (DMT)-like permease
MHIGSDNFTGDSLAILSAVFSAANLLTVEKLRAKFSATTILLWCSFVGAVLTFPIVLAWIIFSEELSPLNWLAFSVVLAGIYIAKPSQGSDKVTRFGS